MRFLDESWIQSGILKRRANYSPILCFRDRGSQEDISTEVVLAVFA